MQMLDYPTVRLNCYIICCHGFPRGLRRGGEGKKSVEEAQKSFDSVVGELLSKTEHPHSHV